MLVSTQIIFWIMKNRKRDIQCGAHYHGSKASYMKCYRARYKPH